MKQITLFTFFLSVLLLFSCTKDEAITVTETDFSELEIALQNDEDYQKLLTHRNAFFTALRDAKINLSGVTDQIGDFAEADFCDLKDNYKGQLVNDVRAFSAFYCKDRTLLKQVIAKYPLYIEYIKGQYNSSRNDNIYKRDCLNDFQWDWISVEANCELSERTCVFYQNDAIDSYNSCCGNGGNTGCP